MKKKWTVLLLNELLKDYVVACEKAKKNGDILLGQDPRFEVRTDTNKISEYSVQRWKQGRHRQSNQAVKVHEKQKGQSISNQKEPRVDIVTIIIRVWVSKVHFN